MNQVYFERTLIVVLVLNSLIGFGQSKLDLFLRLNVFDVPLSNSAVEIGPGYYDANGSLKTTQSIYTGIQWWKWKNVGFSFGIGLRTMKSEARYDISEEIEGLEIQYHEARQMSALGWSPSLGVLYRDNKLLIRLGVTEWRTFNYKRSAESMNVTDSYYNLEPLQLIRKISFSEKIEMIRFPSSYRYWQIGVGYEIIKDLSLHLGFESTLLNNGAFHYRLIISDFHPDSPDVPILRNNFQIQANYSALNIGLDYKFQIK